MSATKKAGVARFEALYANSSDPWGYDTSAYERTKYLDTLAALPAGGIARALEVGCSIGAFTQLLAARCGRVLALDFSQQALALARERLAGVANVELRHARFPEQAPRGEWEAIVCSEVLYYLDAPALARAIDWLHARLRAGASVLAVSWRGVGADEPFLGDEVHDRLLRELGPWHALDGRREGYRLDRFDPR
ncbi:MAG TPA: SAM-dependent methyltransferase [Solirubrobacteraceae bacterium]|nr:SAM-dependent methyltransferase [Solirubrobacteraceae bacterium]